ncbi:MAG: DNA-binding protein WhiA [Clostridia bacterium]|nr:DNA-binding protein WhiA [Clostridia bacterium]
MSFSGTTKQRLADVLPGRKCCRAALLYGLLQGGRGFSAREMAVQTEHPEVVRLYRSLLEEICGIRTETEKGAFTIVSVAADNRARVLTAFGHEPNEVSVRLIRANFHCDDCAAAYLRGLFLSCGAVSNPETDYHLEFNVPSLPLSRDILSLWEELGYDAKTIRRKGDNVIYFKDSSVIEECLTLMGASASALELMQVKMFKDIRNRSNRAANCDMANLNKVVAAAAVHRQALEVILQNGGFGTLPENLQEIAQLRWDNPEISLRDLGELLDPPLTRSGVNHRLQRLCDIADSLRHS